MMFATRPWRSARICLLVAVPLLLCSSCNGIQVTTYEKQPRDRDGIPLIQPWADALTYEKQRSRYRHAGVEELSSALAANYSTLVDGGVDQAAEGISIEKMGIVKHMLLAGIPVKSQAAFPKNIQQTKAAASRIEKAIGNATKSPANRSWYDQNPVAQEMLFAFTWDWFRGLTEEESLWPYPVKVLVVIGLFFFFEYFLNFLAWCSQTFGMSPAFAEQLEPNRRHIERTNGDPGLLQKLSVLTLNVYTNRARENSKNQIRSIRKLNPDVIFLQEVFHLDVLEAYRLAFPDYRLMAFNRAHNLSAIIAVVCIMLVIAAVFAASVLIVEKATDDDMWRAIWTFSVPIMMAIYARLIRHHALIAFLTGNRTGLAMLIRRDIADIKETQLNVYSREGHAADLLNVLRPRGFISVAAALKLPGFAPLRVRFVTTHLNQPMEQALGDGRHRQVKEVFKKCLLDDEFLVLGCDLNATPPGTFNGSDCHTYQDVTCQLSDAWAATNPSDPKRDGLTWDQAENQMSVSPTNWLCYGSKLIRWRCDYVFWRHSSSSRSSSNPERIIDQTPPCREEPLPPPEVKLSVASCALVFTGDAAVSDHYGVYTVFDVRAA